MIQGLTLQEGVNDKVNPGDVILELDLDLMKEHEINLTTPLIIANDNGCEYKIIEPKENVKAGCDQVIVVSQKGAF